MTGGIQEGRTEGGRKGGRTYRLTDRRQRYLWWTTEVPIPTDSVVVESPSPNLRVIPATPVAGLGRRDGVDVPGTPQRGRFRFPVVSGHSGPTDRPPWHVVRALT